MEPERRKALEILNADPLSRQILRHFSWAMPPRAGETFSDIENSPRLTNPFPEAHRAFQQRRAEYIELLKIAVPHFDMCEVAKSILDSPAPQPDKIYIFEVADLESIPAEHRASARALPSGKYRLSGNADLARAMGEKVEPGARQVEKPVADEKQFQMARSSANEPGYFQKYAALSEAASRVGRTVEFIDA